MVIRSKQVVYDKVEKPEIHRDCVPVELTDKTMEKRHQKVIEAMAAKELDVLLIYADREHGGNFAYLTGFAPRFEEAVLVLHRNGRAYLLLGNEMLHMAAYSRIRAEAVHVPYFSLPNQPMDNQRSFRDLLKSAGLEKGLHTGIAGWKLLQEKFYGEKNLLEIPAFIADTVKELVGAGYVENASGILIDPVSGVRTEMDVNEIAFYEYGACLASVGMADLMEQVQPGMTEIEAAGYLENHGEPNCVQTICAAGKRFTGGIVSPRNQTMKRGDSFSATVGYRGGLTNRAAYLVSEQRELPKEQKDYLEKVAKPYYSAAASWYSTVGIGVRAADIYKMTEQVIPKEQYGWTLNPGHYVADEEWVSSPFTADSPVVLKAGMLLQMDIIVKVSGYHGCNAEDGVAILDNGMQKAMAEEYPKVWERMKKRQEYMRGVLEIPVRPEVFPMSDLGGYVRPYLLNKGYALKVEMTI